MEPVQTLAASGPVAVLAVMLGVIVAIPVGVLAIIYLVVPMFKGLAWIIRQVGVFIFSTAADLLRLVGALITAIVLMPLTVGSVIIGRWSASAHYGRAITAEFKNVGRCVYRLVVGNPARLLCLTPLTDGIERRIPEVMAAAPGPDRPTRRQGQFAGYEIVGSLPGGGSGGRLYVAKPDEQKLAAFVRQGHRDVDRVVIKCFSQHDGTTLPQIVRENRALDAAKKLGLILEHDLTNERFYYVMRYVPGDSLNLVTQRLHAAAGNNGLGRGEMHEVLSYASDLLSTLRAYHEGGLWHKDVKPDNVIVAGGQAHLVDFGLVTPLRSSMTLTTHGTEYFRDPEMVRMALKGVKVHEVDGAKFDLYAVGAVLFSMVENSFPAHGGLSQITRPCPDAVRWIVRRAMTDYDKRYQSAAAMLADVQAVLRSGDPFGMRPAHLPSVAANMNADEPVMVGMAGGAMPPPIPSAPFPPVPPAPPVPSAVPGVGHAAAAVGAGWASYPGMNPNVAAPAGPARVGGRMRPEIRVTNWMSGGYSTAGAGRGARPTAGVGVSPFPGMNAAYAAAGVGVAAAAVRATPRVHRNSQEQLRSARERAAAARQRARLRMKSRSASFPAGINVGVVVAVLAFMGVCALAVMAVFSMRSRVTHFQAPVAVVPPADVMKVVVAAPSAGVTVPASSSDATAGAPWDTRVLVLCEWSKFDERRQERIVAQVESLDNLGFLLLGDLGQAQGGLNADTVAQLRSAVGTRPFLSGEAMQTVREWLDETNEAEIVVWFAGEPGKPSKAATAWVIGGTDANPGILSTAEAALKSATATVTVR